jgi:UDP-N-acetylmuramoylalanine--D-glutamate ligase
MKRESFAGKKILVMGLGRFGGGVDAAQFAHRAGAKVIVTDLASAEQLDGSIRQLQSLAGIEFHLGSHEPADFERADIVIANPAVPNDNEFLQIARRAGKCVTSQIGLFFELCPAQIIGITGANGKSTTTALTAHVLEKARRDLRHKKYEKVWLSGNIGNQPLLTVLNQIEADDLVILELSSFQVEQLAQIQKAPNVALLTNLTPNHLDRYETFANYCAAKENIFKFQKPGENCPAVSIFNAQDEVAAGWLAKYSKEAGRICIKFSSDDVSQEIRSVFRLPGRANLSNLAAAMAIARHFGVDDEQVISCLPEFKALPHRLELIAEIAGVSWYNDSKATTPQSAITALEAFDRPVILIAGGYDKHLPFDEFGQEIAEKAKAAILIGQTAPKIAEAIKAANMSLRGAKRQANLKRRGTSHDEGGTKIEIANSLAEAVGLADRLAAPGDVVLLSPACASYDMFENYEQRGREFATLVRTLEAQSVGSRTDSA